MYDFLILVVLLSLFTVITLLAFLHKNALGGQHEKTGLVIIEGEIVGVEARGADLVHILVVLG